MKKRQKLNNKLKILIKINYSRYEVKLTNFYSKINDFELTNVLDENIDLQSRIFNQLCGCRHSKSYKI